jgi:Cu/Ag efflux protein CusF
MKRVLLSAMAAAVALTFALPVRAEETAKPAKLPRHAFTGEITKIDATSVTLKNNKGEEKAFTVGAKVKVVVTGKEAAEMKDLKVGDKMTVSYTEEEGKNVAHRIASPDSMKKKEKKTESAP